MRYKLDEANRKNFKEMYNKSMLTFPGIASTTNNYEAICDFLEECDALPSQGVPEFYIFEGKDMNDCFKLSGDNAYQDDVSFIAVDNISPMMVAVSRLRVGGRWFDDIADNDVRHEHGDDAVAMSFINTEQLSLDLSDLEDLDEGLEL